ncbi:MAG: hypothetical protein IIY58_03495, partial [Aeriscardovia sp.]|nr:hypothetical protein [Aeriscardovia sp.]
HVPVRSFSFPRARARVEFTLALVALLGIEKHNNRLIMRNDDCRKKSLQKEEPGGILSPVR